MQLGYAGVAAGGVDTMIGVVFEVVGEESEGSCFEFLGVFVFGGRGFCSFVVFVSNLRVGTKLSTYQPKPNLNPRRRRTTLSRIQLATINAPNP